MSDARNVAAWHPKQTVFARTQRLCKVWRHKIANSTIFADF